MGMKINGEYTFNGPREVAFAVVRDPNLLLLAIPGESSMKETGPNSYEGTIKLKDWSGQRYFRRFIYNF